MEKINENERILVDKSGRRFHEIQQERIVPRRTYLKGKLHGKYWGELDRILANEYHNSQFYDFYIYEVTVTDTTFSTQPFVTVQDSRFPRERLPESLPVRIEQNHELYAVNIHEPVFEGSIIDRKLHQNDGELVFGTIEAVITGYLLDFVIEQYTERNYLPEPENITTAVNRPEPPHDKTQDRGSITPESPNWKVSSPHVGESLGNLETWRDVPSGRTETRGNYHRLEYIDRYGQRYWGAWKPASSSIYRSNNSLGCAIDLINVFFYSIFITYILSQLPVIIPVLALLGIFYLLRRGINLGINLLVLLISAFYIWALIESIGKVVSTDSRRNNLSSVEPIRPGVKTPGSVRTIRPNPTNQQESLSTTDTTREPSVNPSALSSDLTLIWTDYLGRSYEGHYQMPQTFYLNSHDFKNEQDPIFSAFNYRQLVYRLSTHDRPYLVDVYAMFDSIGTANSLDRLEFAEMIVSCIQHVPYALLLPTDCNKDLYTDEFISTYLKQPDSECDGRVKFGINTPVEFMASLRGDCDTRSLLLFTILSHYGYDVMMLNSTHYKHSLIGINLPYPGVRFSINNHSYALWETTAPNYRPGEVPIEYTDLRHWTVTLQNN